MLEQRHDLPVLSVVIVLRPEADSPRLSGAYERSLPGRGRYRTFEYQVLRVWQLPPEHFLAGGLGTLPLAPISAVTEAELPGIIQQMKVRLRRRDARAQARELWTAAFVLMGVRYSADVAQALLQGVGIMKDSTTYQAIVKEGEQLGRVREARDSILELGEAQFGAPPARARRRLEALTDIDRLKALRLRLLRVSSWDELLAEEPPPAQRRKGAPPPG